MGLKDYYKLIFQLIHNHNYSLTELESMLPWERDIYISQLIEYIEIENEKLQIQQIETQARGRM
jgi:hypothetical protein